MGKIASDCRLSETPIAVVDFETTGLTAGPDRVVEAAVIRCEPDGTARVMLDTLVNPQRTVGATEIHGIRDEDVKDAPTFRDIADQFANSIQGCVIAAYNVYFDIRFLNHEMGFSGKHEEPPHVCLMYMRPMLGMGAKGPLERTCQELGVNRPVRAHTAGDDAESSAALLALYRKRASELGITTFGELRQLKSYKFGQSLDRVLPEGFLGKRAGRGMSVKSRRDAIKQSTPRPPATPGQTSLDQPYALKAYTEALKAALSDLQVNENEVAALSLLRKELQIGDGAVRGLHARLFAHAITRLTEDRTIDDEEAAMLRQLHAALHRLGWAPGQ